MEPINTHWNVGILGNRGGNPREIDEDFRSRMSTEEAVEKILEEI